MPRDVREEAVSIAFSAIVRAAGVFEDRGGDVPFKSYAWRCVRGRILDIRGRDAAKAGRVGLGLEGWDVCAPEDGEAWLREAEESLPQRLAALLPREREAIVRFFGLGGRGRESHAELASSFGVSRQAVNSILQRATAKLRLWYGVPDARAKKRRSA
jgi:RNA polymerase sigma factor (sigma-70 family)